MAVFTLPTDMIPFFKGHIGYLSEHAVDPDIRRYATQYEAVRHYIDADHWGENPFDVIPRDLNAAIAKYAVIHVIHEEGDTTTYDFGYTNQQDGLENVTVIESESNDDLHALRIFKDFIFENVQYYYYEEEWPIDYKYVRRFKEIKWKKGDRAVLFDRFTSYGILPFYLQDHYRKLVKAFENKETKRILSLAADMGHYMGDAHVPLHTTVNYNGQLTGQLGIHAFWESRIPEVSAEENYDFFVGKAKYIRNKSDYFWNIVEESFEMVDDVLRLEREVSESFPKDQQYCYTDRLNRNTRLECPEYAKAYEQLLAGTIEKRMQESVHAIGSVWYSAWVDAGKPKLDFTEVEDEGVDQTILESDTKRRTN